VGIIRFVLIGILVFILLRFLSRLVAEVRSYMGRGASPQPGPRQSNGRREDHRDIQEAKFEDVRTKTKRIGPLLNHSEMTEKTPPPVFVKLALV